MTVRRWKIDDPQHPLRAVIDRLQTDHLMTLDQIAKIAAEVEPNGFITATVTIYLPPPEPEALATCHEHPEFRGDSLYHLRQHNAEHHGVPIDPEH